MTKEKAIEELKEVVKEGDTIYTILRHVSKSGLTRDISLIVIKDNRPLCIDYWASIALDLPLKNNGIRVSGAGMDMGFALVYDLSYALYTDGYKLNWKWL